MWQWSALEMESLCIMQTLSSKQKELTAQELVTSNTVREIEEASSKRWRTFTALRHRNFRLFWLGQLISLIGTWMQTIGQSWLVLRLTGSAWALGIVGALQFVPILFFALFGGILADNLPKRRVLVFTQTFAMIQAAVLGVLVMTHTVQLWHVYVLALLLGLTNAFDMPTRQSFVVEMVGREDLTNAIALNSSLFNMARIVGPGIGGLIIAWLGEAPLFVINAVSFVPVIAGLLMIDTTKLHAPVKHAGQVVANKGVRGTFLSLGEGLRYIQRTPLLLLTIIIVGAVSLFGINFNVMLPLFATNVLSIGPDGYGFLSSAYGVGSLVAALWIATQGKKPIFKKIVLFCIAFSALEVIFSFSKLPMLSFLIIALVGFTQISFSAAANTLLQTVTPDHLRGRIMSVYTLVFVGTTPIGNLFIGGLASALGASIAFLVGGALSLIAAIIGWVIRASAEQDTVEQRTNVR